jgi:hypothetical protein
VRSGRRSLGAVFLLAAGAALFVAGEEISWGQRIFGWETPESLAELNRQGETNIHNIGSVLRLFNLTTMLASLYAVIVPIAWRLRAGSRRRTIAETILVPPAFLASGFFIMFAYRLIRFTLLPDGAYVISRYQEVTELTFYFGGFVFLLLVRRRLAEGSSREPAVGAAASRA